ncbi:hypothetical protein D3C76_690820 [compost metagenome]
MGQVVDHAAQVVGDHGHVEHDRRSEAVNPRLGVAAWRGSTGAALLVEWRQLAKIGLYLRELRRQEVVDQWPVTALHHAKRGVDRDAVDLLRGDAVYLFLERDDVRPQGIDDLPQFIDVAPVAFGHVAQDLGVCCVGPAVAVEHLFQVSGVAAVQCGGQDAVGVDGLAQRVDVHLAPSAGADFGKPLIRGFHQLVGDVAVHVVATGLRFGQGLPPDLRPRAVRVAAVGLLDDLFQLHQRTVGLRQPVTHRLRQRAAGIVER